MNTMLGCLTPLPSLIQKHSDGDSVSSVQFTPLTNWIVGGARGGGGGIRDNSAYIFFQSVLQEALVNSSRMGRDVHSLMFSISPSNIFLCRTQRRPNTKVACGIVSDKLLRRAICPNHASFLLNRPLR